MTLVFYLSKNHATSDNVMGHFLLKCGKNQPQNISGNSLGFTNSQLLFWEEQKKDSKNKNTKIKLGKMMVAN